MKRLGFGRAAAAVTASAALVAGGRAFGRRRRARRHVAFTTGHRHRRGTAPGDCRLSVVVPAFREERIGATVQRLRRDLAAIAMDGGVEIVVVDDGSGDGTGDRARDGGADLVISQPVNRGKGAAVRAGVLAARGRTIAFTDADLSYAPHQLLGLLDAIEGGWDVAVGSRRHPESSTVVAASALRDIGGRVINGFSRVAVVGRHADTQCGIKAFRSDTGRVLFRHALIDGFAFDVEIFHLVESYGLSLTEVPVVVENSDRSTVNVVRDALRLIADVFRIRAWSRSGAYDLGLEDREVLAPGP